MSKQRYLIAEYCPGPFYWGWWLYLREKNDGSDDGGWVRYDWHRDLVRAFLVSVRPDAPCVLAHGQNLAEWFAENYSGGMLIEVDESAGEYRAKYKLIEVVPVPPKQVDRRIIRTIRRAKASFARSCRERNLGKG